MPKVIRHPRSEGYALALFGLAVYFALSIANPILWAGFEERTAIVIDLGLAALAWYVARFVLTCRRGLTVRYEWNPRHTVLRIVLGRQLRELAAIRLEVTDYYGNETVMSRRDIEDAILRGLKPHAAALQTAEVLHFVGAEQDDVQSFMRLARQTMGGLVTADGGHGQMAKAS